MTTILLAVLWVWFTLNFLVFDTLNTFEYWVVTFLALLVYKKT